MNRRALSLLLPLSLPLLLTACGYGWQPESHVYPPSHPGRAGEQGRAASAVAGPGEYLVQPGDTLYSIGFRNQLDYHDLANWNDIGADYRIRAGQVIRLTPPPGTDAVLAQPLPSAAPLSGAPQPIPAPTPIPPADSPSAKPAPIIATAPSVAVPASPPVGPLPGPVVQTPAPSVPPVVKPVLAASGFKAQWPTSGEVIKTYNLAAGSKGVDIAGDIGQPVVAAAAGKVVYSGSALKGYGELIIIKHDDTYLSAYGHNRKRLVKEGDDIKAGQTIAELGIGPEQKPLLHFEIREHGKPVDPLQFLPTR